jgi:hypothetical protein
MKETLELLKPYMIDFDKLKVGDKVFSTECGYGNIKEIYPSTDTLYPIIVDFQNNRVEQTFTRKGYCFESNELPQLFKCNIFEALAKPNQERVVLVSNNVINWHKRVLIKKIDGEEGISRPIFITWYNAESLETSKNAVATTVWKYMKELEEEPSIPEYTMAEAIAKMGHEFKLKK